MASLATVIKRDLSGMGKFLFVGALADHDWLAIINIFVGSTIGMMVISVMAIGIFSAYMLYDIKQIIDGGETNYITATLGPVPGPVQRVPEPAGPAREFGGQRKKGSRALGERRKSLGLYAR